MTVTNVGTNTFSVLGTPFGLQVGDVIAHYGRGIPFNNGTGGPSSVYIAANLPPPVVGNTITVPSSTYPLYNDGGRNYAVEVQLLGQPFLVTTNSDNGPGSLRQAVLDANAFSSASAIKFATNLSGQTILLTIGQIALSNNVTIDASALASGIQINGNGQSRIFEIPGSSTVVLNSLTLSNGNDNNDPSEGGGAILNFGTLTVSNCTFTGNQANGFLDQNNDPSGGNGGGGIYSPGTLTVDNSTFIGNEANTGLRGGGGIYAEGTLTVNNSTFTGNQANNAFYGGGGIDADGTLTVNNSTFTGNQANYSFGGGIYGYAVLTNCIFYANSATYGEEVAGDMTIVNCLLGPESFANSADTAYNGFTLINSVTNANALLAPLGNYGGPTPTMPPSPGSPAIDAGAATMLTTDQRGFPRVVGPSVDIGAVEFQASPVVTTNDSIPGSLRYAVAYVNNNANINFDPGLSGQTITLTNGQITVTKNLTIGGRALANGIQNPDGRIFQINSGASVFMNSLILTNGNCTSAGGAILNEGGDLTLNRCTLAGNLSQGDGGGGAIFNDVNSILNLNECTLTANRAYQQGGAIYNFNQATLAMDNCTIFANTADETSSPRGGTGGGGVFNSGTMVLDEDIVAGNSDPVAANISGSYTGANNLINGNPLLAALGDYGGPTPTMPPLPGSPAIDAGGSALFTTDQRGFPRPIGLAADIGAVEGVYNSNGPGKIKTITRLGNGSVQLSFTNVTDAVFPVLATTNLSLALSNWVQTGFATESPLGSGQFPFTDTDATNYPQRFYLISSP
jgi:hypothetical protein